MICVSKDITGFFSFRNTSEIRISFKKVLKNTAPNGVIENRIKVDNEPARLMGIKK